MNAPQVVEMLKALLQGPTTRFELAERTGLTPKTVGQVLTGLKDESLIHVLGHANASDGRNRVKVYTLGEGEDAQPQASRPQRLRSRKSYLKKVEANSDLNIKTTFAGGVSPWKT